MSIPGSASPLFFQTAAGAAAAAGPIKSVRFNDDDSAYLNRTPSSAGNRKTWTWAGWIKRSSTGNQRFFTAGANGTYDSMFQFVEQGSHSQLEVWNYQAGDKAKKRTKALFRDFSAWYHVVVSCTSSTLKIYVNGTEADYETGGSNVDPDGSDWSFNSTVSHTIGKTAWGSEYFNGYLADVYWIDGQAKDPTDFGAFDDNGVWQAATYSGTFGTNGFHLFDFANESGIGNDSSGNDNDWTVNNIVDSAISYGTTTNSSQTNANTYIVSDTRWSFDTSYPGEQAFDGSTSTAGTFGQLYFYAENGYSKPTVTNSSGGVEVMAAGNGITAAINQGTQVACANGSFTKISGTFDGTLNSINVYGNTTGASYFYAVKVNGVHIAVRLRTDSPEDLDVLRDVPVNGDSSDDTGAGGELSSNYCTWNPLVKAYAGAFVFKNGNMEAHNAASTYGVVMGTIPMSSGKWYWEVTVNGTPNNTYDYIGIVGADSGIAYPTLTTIMPNQLWYRAGGTKLNGNTSSSYGATYGDGDVIGVALDLDSATKTLTFYKNGTSQGTAFSGSLLSKTWVCAVGDYSNALTTTSWNANWGQRAFAHSAPSGFKALCTTNLATPTVADGSKYFQTALITGNNSTQAITTTDMSPDFVWLKRRNQATYSHSLVDSVRGAGKRLASEGTYAEDTFAAVSSFDSEGFTLGNTILNSTGASTVAWAWDAGSSTASNTDGSITSSVRASQTSGVSIISYTGNGSSSGSTVGHGLGAAPDLLIIKSRGTSYSWIVWHNSFTAKQLVYLNHNYQIQNDKDDHFNNTLPTNQVFSLRESPAVNSNGTNFICYAFAAVEGFSAFGSYEGNGNADGPFISLSFKPALFIYKRYDTGNDWGILDNTRSTFNINNKGLYANLTNSESTADRADFLSNGVKIRATLNEINANGGDYLYIAFAENPFQANGGLAR